MIRFDSSFLPADFTASASQICTSQRAALRKAEDDFFSLSTLPCNM
jgi:hypothetical protein